MDHKPSIGQNDADLVAGRADSANGRIAAGPPHQTEGPSWRGFDARLAAAIQDVSVPSGLADRLLAKLQSAENESIGSKSMDSESILPADTIQPGNSVQPGNTVQSANAVTPADAPARKPRRFSRRATIGLAVAASLLVAAGVWVIGSRDSQPLDPAPLAETWYAALMEQNLHWHTKKLADKNLPIPAAVVAQVQGWLAVGNIVGYKSVAYKLNGAQPVSVLFVVQMPAGSAGSLPSSPPVHPQSTSGGLTIGVWQSGGLRYALVVAGDERAYRSLINSTAPPLAWLPFSNPRGFTDRETAL